VAIALLILTVRAEDNVLNEEPLEACEALWLAPPPPPGPLAKTTCGAIVLTAANVTKTFRKLLIGFFMIHARFL
jgi:hypothetical protein